MMGQLSDELTATVKYRSDGAQPEGADCVMFGGWVDGQSWEEYIAEDWADPRIPNAIRRAIEGEGLIGLAAMNRSPADSSEMLCNDIFFQLSNGQHASFSFRGWGDLMAALVGKGESYAMYYGPRDQD